MAKSLRSKRKMRLRTIKREIAEPYYDSKEVEKQTALEAAMAAPKVEVRQQSSMDVEEEEQTKVEGEEKRSDAAMETDIQSLKPTKKIKKRSKSKGRLKKERHRQKKLKF